MTETLRIVCLANSRKPDGRCIAGKVILPNGQFGQWIRPVSVRETKSVSWSERKCTDFNEPALGDILEIRLLQPVPHGHQTENYLLDPTFPWSRKGKLNWAQLGAIVDAFPGALWCDGSSSTNGVNDQIPAAAVLKIRGSLLFLQPDQACISIKQEASSGKLRIRAKFHCSGKEYLLAMTDPLVERVYRSIAAGEYPIGEARLCISAGDPFPTATDPCYKFVAAVFCPGGKVTRPR